MFCLFAKSKLEPWAKGKEQVLESTEAVKTDAVSNMIASFEGVEHTPVTKKDDTDKVSLRSHRKPQTKDTGVQATDLNEVIPDIKADERHHF